MPTQRIQVLIRGSSVHLFHRQTDDVRQVHVYDNDNDNEANKVEVLLPFDFNLDDVNYIMCSLLDAIDIASGEDDMERIRVLLSGRFAIAEKHGLTVLLGDTGGRQ